MVDFAVFGLLMVSALIGVARGFTREVLGIFAWVTAFIIALYGLVLVRPLLSPYIKSPFVVDVVAGLLIFVIALFFLGSLSRMASGTVKGSVLGGLDRSLGFVFGIVRGGVIIVLAYFVGSVVSNVNKWPDEIKHAKFYPYVVDGANWVRHAVPDSLITNMGLRDAIKEPAEGKPTSLDHVVSALSQPKAAATKEAPAAKDGEQKKEEGYADTHRNDMERLVKNNE